MVDHPAARSAGARPSLPQRAEKSLEKQPRGGATTLKPFVPRISGPVTSRVSTKSGRSGTPRVLMVHCYYRDLGGENLSFEAETELLRENGVEVTTYTRDNRELDQLRLLARLRVGIGTVWAGDVHADLGRLVRETNPDVVHFQNTFPLISPAALHAAHRAGAAVVQALRNYRPLCVSGVLFRDGRICHDCVGKLAPHPAIQHSCYHDSRVQSAAVVSMQVVHHALGTWRNAVELSVAPSEFARGVFVSAGADPNRIVVKPNFVHPDPGPNQSQGVYALFAGRLAREKGVLTLVRAWAKVPDLRLVIAGDGPLRSEVEREIELLGLFRRIDLVGYKTPEEVIGLMRQARCVVFPSEWYETFGRTAAEAFACGVPVVASRLGAMAEVVTDGVTGRLFEAGNSSDLAMAIHSLVAARDPAAMAAAARHAYLQRFTAAGNLESLLAIYDRAIALRRKV